MSISPSQMFESATTQRRLKEIYRDHIQSGVARGRDGIAPDAFETDLESECKLIQRRLRDGTYSYTQYKEHLKSKGAEKLPRVVSIPTVRDRIALRAVADTLIGIYPHAQGQIPQVPIRKLTEELRRSSFESFIRIDVKDFYPSISHAQVEKALARRIRKRELIEVVKSAITTPTVPEREGKKPPQNRGVPQGLAVSNVLSELVISTVDAEAHKMPSLRYFRFVDDILILCNQSDVDAYASAIFALLGGQELSGHPLDTDGGKSTTGQVGRGFEYLGYRFTEQKVSVRRSSVLSIESRLAREFSRYKRACKTTKNPSTRILENRLNLAITGCIWDSTSYGWLSYFRQIDDLTLLKGLDLHIVRLKARFQIPDDVRFKTFMRAYWAILHPGRDQSQYVPRFDNLSIPQMRDRMKDYMSIEQVESLHDRAVPRAFRTLMTKLTAELEQDIGNMS